jgi:polygalacturonase
MDAQACARTARGGVFSITSFGAVGDGVTINTAAFAKTIAFAAAQGGGTVVRLCERI